jgi:ABC-type antimicrobial peptide transport system permease subunit
VIGDSVAQPRLLTALLTLFGALALLLGAIGIYGVMAYAVGQRKQEMGIRAALGARPADLLRLVLGEGARTALLGTAVGILGALLLSGALASQLYQVEPLDPLSYGLVALLVLGVALLATLIPARRAGGVRQDALLRDS